MNEMQHFRFIVPLVAAATLAAAAGRSGGGPAVGTAPSPSASVSTAALSDSWRGSIYQIGASSTQCRRDIRLQIHDDLTWRATSTAGGRRVEGERTLVARGFRLSLTESGMKSLLLRRSGDTLCSALDSPAAPTASGVTVVSDLTTIAAEDG